MEKNTYSIEYLPKDDCLKVKLVGFLSKESYQRCWRDALNMLKEHKILKFLIDMEESGVISSENQEWLQKEYFPKMYALPQFSSMYVARILKKGNVFGVVSAQHIDRVRNTQEKSPNPRAHRDFFDASEAMDWLRSQ